MTHAWHGVHASVLAEPTAIIDFTEAFGSAGVVARHDLALTTG